MNKKLNSLHAATIIAMIALPSLSSAATYRYRVQCAQSQPRYIEITVKVDLGDAAHKVALGTPGLTACSVSSLTDEEWKAVPEGSREVEKATLDSFLSNTIPVVGAPVASVVRVADKVGRELGRFIKRGIRF
jgi:hypothetical protein